MPRASSPGHQPTSARPVAVVAAVNADTEELSRPKRGRGRPFRDAASLKLQPILDEIEAGTPISKAYVASNINQTTWFRWMRIFPEVKQQAHKAQDRFLANLSKRVVREVSGRDGITVLERRDKENWGKPEEKPFASVTNTTVNNSVHLHVTPDLLAQIQAAQAIAEGAALNERN